MTRKWYRIPTKDDEESGEGKIPDFTPLETPEYAYSKQVSEDYFYILMYQNIPFYELTRTEVEDAGINYDRTISGGVVL